MEEQIANIMKNLHCSREEAIDVIQCDQAIDHGEKVYFDLDAESEKIAKAYSKTGTRTTDGKVERKRKENPTKAGIITAFAQFLNENGYEMVNILNAERQIAFKVGENDFELTLTQKRKPKK